VNGEAIYATRPWKHYQEGDVRYTRSKGGKFVYAICLKWPGDELCLKRVRPRPATKVFMLGVDEPLAWRLDDARGLVVELPKRFQIEANRPCRQAYAFKLEGEPCEVPVPPARLLTWLPLEKAAGPMADASGRGRDGTCKGTIAVVDGKVGRCFRFDGTPANVTVPAAWDVNLTSHSIVFWMKADGRQSGHMMPITRSYCNTPWTVQINPGGSGKRTLRYIVRGESLDTTFSTDEWTHVAITQHDADVTMYINGQPTQEGTLPQLPIGNDPIRLGARGDGHFFRGDLDEVACFQGVLSADEVREIHRQGLSRWSGRTAPVSEGPLALTLKRREQLPDGSWEAVATDARLDPRKTAVVVVDMWDNHWCKTLAARVAALVPAMNETLDSARGRGMTVIHAPSDVVDFYRGHAARKAVLALPAVEAGTLQSFEPPAPPWGRTGGCCCGPERPCKVATVWKRQIESLRIADGDYLVDCNNAADLLRVCRAKGITHLVYMGVHTNMCVLNRGCGILSATRHGFPCALVRDLTDAATGSGFDPDRGVPDAGLTPDAGTVRVVEHLERYVLPTISREQLRLRATSPSPRPALHPHAGGADPLHRVTE
jgi:nicotinamidase-related amidase